MKQIITLIFALTLFVLNGWAQERIPADIADGQFYVIVLSPNIAYEHGLSEKLSLFTSAGLRTLSDEDNDGNFYISLNPTIAASLRNYYSRKRVRKQLNNNSGNYIGLSTRYHFGSIADDADFDFSSNENDDSFIIAAVWGIQRNYQIGIHLGIELGLGFIVGKNRDIGGGRIAEFTLGFTIGGRKAKMPQSWLDSPYR